MIRANFASGGEGIRVGGPNANAQHCSGRNRHLISMMAASNQTVAVTDARGEAHNVTVIYGLHVAIPDDMKTFPVELVPLP